MTDVLDAIGRAGVVPVLTIDDPEDAPLVATALASGGLQVIEITLRTAVAVEAIRRAADVADVVVGAGSVTSPAHVDAVLAAGARFVVSPGLDEAVVEAARDRDVPVVPGIATATELQRATLLDLDVVKLFPAGLVGGTRMVAALGAVWPDVRFVPTGGITLADLPAYLDLPQVLAVGGSWVADPTMVRAGEWAAITAAATDARAVVEARR